MGKVEAAADGLASSSAFSESQRHFYYQQPLIQFTLKIPFHTVKYLIILKNLCFEGLAMGLVSRGQGSLARKVPFTSSELQGEPFHREGRSCA